MKKLLLLTNFVCVCFLFASCQNLRQKKIENVSVTQQAIKNDTNTKDTAKVLKQNSAPETVGTDQGTEKDSTKKTVKTNAVIHKAPDQEKIDSIKNAKLKNKK